mmetsp:Transcript_95167/g.138988  ORF Transcript_95167/g.138988 Transcript_95167/m.138988 type:complete len:100 (-) Transcript_95167:39-338(-)
MGQKGEHTPSKTPRTVDEDFQGGSGILWLHGAEGRGLPLKNCPMKGEGTPSKVPPTGGEAFQGGSSASRLLQLKHAKKESPPGWVCRDEFERLLLSIVE